MGLELEGAPGVVEAVRVLKAHIAAGSAVLGMAALKPEDVFGNASLDSNRECPHAAADAGEAGWVDPDVLEGGCHVGGNVGAGRLGLGSCRVASGALVQDEPRKKRRALAPCVRLLHLSAAGKGTSAEHVHEHAGLVVDIELRVDGLAEAHVVTLALLVLFALQSV